MKKVLVFLSLAAIALVSCQKEASLKDEASPKATRTFKCVIASEDDIATAANIDSRVAIAADGKTTWEVGDEILVHGEGSSNRITVTLTAEDISADGKTATITVEGVTPYDRSDKGYTSTYYASYPASAFASGNTYYNSVLVNCNKPLMAGYNDEDTMVFYNLCGIITFSVAGDFDNYVFAGNQEEPVAYDVFQSRLAKTTTGEVLDFLRSGDGFTPQPLKTVEANIDADGTTLYYICIPNGVNFASGFTFKFKDGDDIVKVAVNNNPVNVARGKILHLGNITSKLVDYVAPTVDPHESAIPIAGAVDLTASNDPANCYVLTAPGTYKFPAYMGCSDTPAGNVWGVELLWETYNNSDEVTANSVIAAVDYQANWIYFQTPETLKPGNALIAAKNYEGDIIWSWHIWIPQTAIITDTYSLYSSPMMDRFLGALVAASVDSVPVESFGLTYQWGRKDPFVGPGAVGANGNATVAGKACSTTTPFASVAASIKNPTVIAFVGDGNWLTASDNTLWKDAVKTIYDPCPPGYRVPARDKTQPLHASDYSAVTGWSDNAGYFTMGDPVTVFPYAGYRDDWDPAAVAQVGSRVAIWTAYASADLKAYHMNVRNASTHALGETSKARGGYIRCVEE